MKFRIPKLLPLLLSFGVATALANPGDDAFLQARTAFAKGDLPRVTLAIDKMQDNELRMWAVYYQLRLQIDNDPPSVPEFLSLNAGTLAAERLRSDWVKSLGKRGRWDDVLREYPKLQQPDNEALCYDLQARMQTNDAAVLDDAKPLWAFAPDLPDSCKPIVDMLARQVGNDALWLRVRRLLELRKPQSALRIASYLPDAQAPDPRALDATVDNPIRFLVRLPAKYFSDARNDRGQREILLFTIDLISDSDPSAAADQFAKFDSNFPASERAYGWGQIALDAAKKLMPEALGWYAKAEQANLSDEQLAWWVRSALRAGNWSTVRRVIQRMSPTQAAEPDWIYWNGRALDALGKHAEAVVLWRSIAGQPNFYGSLAADELDQPIVLPPRAAPPTPKEMGEAMANEGLRRALALIRVDARLDGVREWNWSLRGMSDRQLLAAAELARRNNAWDRVINTADRTVNQHDYSLRYLAPYRDKVEPKALQLQLDPGWVYGLMRQESRFVIQAKSGVGAQGLMQVMPKTAAWVAKKIGLSGYHPKHAMDMDTNVTLGTNYMRMVLDGLDDHPVLASAAYNAGPGRAKKWRADVPLEGAIYTECIPFNETRDYVKKVMNNSVYYDALFEGKPQSLKDRLGIVRPRGAGDSGADALP